MLSELLICDYPKIRVCSALMKKLRVPIVSNVMRWDNLFRLTTSRNLQLLKLLNRDWKSTQGSKTPVPLINTLFDTFARFSVRCNFDLSPWPRISKRLVCYTPRVFVAKGTRKKALRLPTFTGLRGKAVRMLADEEEIVIQRGSPVPPIPWRLNGGAVKNAQLRVAFKARRRESSRKSGRRSNRIGFSLLSTLVERNGDGVETRVPI